MSGIDLQPVAVTGDSVVLHIGCSEQWAGWVRRTVAEARQHDRDAVQLRVLLLEDEHGVCSAFRASIHDQLDGGDPAKLLDHAPYEYKLGFGAEHAREVATELETALDFGAAGHRLDLTLHISTATELADQLGDQVPRDDSSRPAEGST